jgi:hypothetical protein
MAEERRENILEGIKRRERAAAPVRRDPFGFEIGEGERRTPSAEAVLEPQRLFASSVRPASDILQVDPDVSFEGLIAREKRIERLTTQIGKEQTEAARKVRTALQLSERTGSDVPIDVLLEGRWNLPGQPRRAQPTRDQRERLYEAGRPYKGDESGVKSSGKKKK